MSSTNPPPGSWIPSFLSRYANPAPPLPQSTAAKPTATPLPPRDPNAPAPNSIYTPRGRKQASIFFAGVIGIVWAGSMTRRSLTKRKVALPLEALAEAAPTTTMGQGAQVGRAIGQQGTAAVAGTEALQGAKAGGIMSETLHAYRGGVRQTSPGTSIGSAAGNALAKPAGEVLTHATAPAAAGSAEEAAAAAAAELNASGPILAMEALFLATANVLAWALMVTGGVLWYTDISSVEEMRRAVRGGLGVDGTGRTAQEAEEEMEEWLARMIKRGEDRDARERVNERGQRR